MEREWSSSWKSSNQPRKQRKYRHNAPLHTKQKFVAVHLSKELRKKYQRRSLTARKGDVVKILRGQFSGKTGKVLRVDLKKSRLHIEGIENIKKDGTKKPYPLQPSNLAITELNLDDKLRQEKLGANKKEK